MTYEIVSERRLRKACKISTAKDAYAAFERYATASTERFIVGTLNGAHEIISLKIISIGSVNKTIVHPREVFRSAILDDSVAIIIGHNHPSNHLEPSDEDLAITKRLRAAGEILGISVLDHLIIGKKSYYSFIEHDLFSVD